MTIEISKERKQEIRKKIKKVFNKDKRYTHTLRML